jgi:glycosyltransferase involved in cell wall biosynthesis
MMKDTRAIIQLSDAFPNHDLQFVRKLSFWYAVCNWFGSALPVLSRFGGLEELMGPLVTVVVPAFNAESTIDACLKSVRAQSYQDLEILVVNDGSVDATSEIVKGHIRHDSRIRIIEQKNLGVAEARNRAIAEARGEYIAPVDADDLWLRSKLEKQVAAAMAGGASIGLVYTWYARVDLDGFIVDNGPAFEAEGWVLHEMCRRNLIGNGSSVLMRKSAILAAGGYDPALPACEDLKLYMQIACHYQFLVIKEYLTGYRESPAGRSSDLVASQEAYDQVMFAYLDRFPEYRLAIRAGRSDFIRWQILKAYRARNWRALAFLSRELCFQDRASALGFLLSFVLSILMARVKRARSKAFASPSKFLDA